MLRTVGVPEARIAETEHGAVVESEGWFVLNAADAGWTTHELSGRWVSFEGESHPFSEFGIGIHVLEPGEPNGKYHAEAVQEDFLVLSGECICLIEGEERRLKAWDFVHCPPGTLHIFVGAGDGPCAILMAGTRRKGRPIHYPLDELAARYGASAPFATDKPPEAYSDWSLEFQPVRGDWPLST
jgi:uncharacterized cupin superfamily protein